MLDGLFGYGGIAAKSKAIKAKQLTENDFEQLMQKTSLAEIISFLKNNTHYADIFKYAADKGIHRGDIENPLKEYYASVLKKYYSFITGYDRKYIEFIFLREEIEALKNILRRIEGEREKFISPIDPFISEHFSIDINKLSSAVNIYQFMEYISGTRYEKVLGQLINAGVPKNMFSLEMALDSYYFKYIYKKTGGFTKNKSDGIMNSVYGKEMDMLNIMWIYRCKKYYDIPKEMIYIHHIPHRYSLTNSRIKEMVDSERITDFYRVINDTEYRCLIKGLDGENNENVYIENNYNKCFSEMLYKMEKENPFSIAPVISEIHSVKGEIRKIVNIVECIRYGLNSAQIKKMIG